MAKRFTDTDKWKKDWFLTLTPTEKVFWGYLCDTCSLGGIWNVSWKSAEFHVGTKLDPDEIQKTFSKQFVPIDGGKKWFIIDFITFQYKHLNPNNPAHKGAIEELRRYSMVASDFSIVLSGNNLKGAPEELPSPSQGAKDKSTATGMDKGTGTDKAATSEFVESITGAPPDEQHFPLEETLLQHWGSKGRLGYGIMTQFVDLIRTHGWERVEYAIKEAGTHSACSFAYVKGILSPSKKTDEVTVGSKQDYFGFQTFLTQAGKKNGEGYSVEVAVPGKEWKFCGEGIGALFRQFKPANSQSNYRR
jgi:hypothetical protein